MLVKHGVFIWSIYVVLKAGKIHVGDNWGWTYTQTQTFYGILFIYKESYNHLILRNLITFYIFINSGLIVLWS